jgi:hypothetical protein
VCGSDRIVSAMREGRRDARVTVLSLHRVTMMIRTISGTIVVAAGFFLVGRLFDGHSEKLAIVRSLIVGYATTIIVYAYGFRLGVKPELTLTVYGAVVLVVGLVRLPWLVNSVVDTLRIQLVRNLGTGAALASGLIVPLFPLLGSRSLFFFHTGPDLQGHLLSAASLREGRSYSDALEVMKETSGSTSWWSLSDKPWAAADFREALEVEFLLRCLRLGHAAITTVISQATQLPVAESLLVGICFAFMLTAFSLYRMFRVLGVSLRNSIVLSLFAVFSHSYVLMAYEGVTAQLFALPLFVTAITEFSLVLRSRLGVKSIVRLSVLVGALAVTMTEALQLLVAFLIVLTVSMILKKSTRNLGIRFSKTIISTAAMTLILMPLQALDVLRNFILRFQQSFRYSGFGIVEWEPLSLIMSFPFLTVAEKPGLLVSVTSSKTTLMLQGLALAVCAIWIAKKYPSRSAHLFTSAVFLMFVVILTGGSYPLWKYVVFFQAVLLATPAVILEKRFGVRAISCVASVALAGVLITTAVLLTQYQRHAIKLSTEDFKYVVPVDVHEKVVLVTPLSSGLYVNLGASGPFVYANSGWGPQFGPVESEWQISLYFSCEIEGEARCDKINAHTQGLLKERSLSVSQDSIRVLLTSEGFVDRGLLEQYIQRRFGVSSTEDIP